MLHQIGAGALGPVFRAYQPEQDRLVAVKLFRLDIPPERSHQLVVQLERLIAADLAHPGIAAPLATGLSDVSAYLAMDFVAADSLDMVIRDQRVTAPADVGRIATQLASALDLAAAIEITHGALHPRDVLLSADDVRITGIGIARALEQVGTAAPIRRPYTAPERASGGAWDRRADVFSLAALTFELLTHRRISGPGEQPFDAFGGIQGVSAEALDRVFDRALAERPGDRFPTASDFARALNAALERKRAAATRIGAPVRAPIPPPSVEPTTPVPPDELPLFTDAMLGERTARAAAAEDVPPPVVDAAHEALDPDLTLRDAGFSMVDSMHDSDIRSNGHSRGVDDHHSAAHDANGRRMSIDEFTEEMPSTPTRRAKELVAADRHPETPEDVMLKRHEAEIAAVEPVAIAADIPTRAPFESVELPARSSSGVWPLMLALVVGIALGFGMAMLLLGRDRVPAAPQQASSAPSTRPATELRDEPIKEVTEQTVTSPPPTPVPAPEPKAAAKGEPPSPVANTPAPVPTPSASSKAAPRAPRPPAAAAPRPAPDRPDARTARPPAPRTTATGRTPVPAPKAAPARPSTNASRTGATSATPRNAARPTAPAKPAAQTPAKPPSGSLAVESRPTGANVYIDGRLMGKTPVVLDTVKAGQYTIGLDLDGYKRWATTVRVTVDERSRVAASLER